MNCFHVRRLIAMNADQTHKSTSRSLFWNFFYEFFCTFKCILEKLTKVNKLLKILDLGGCLNWSTCRLQTRRASWREGDVYTSYQYYWTGTIRWMLVEWYAGMGDPLHMRKHWFYCCNYTANISDRANTAEINLSFTKLNFWISPDLRYQRQEQQHELLCNSLMLWYETEMIKKNTNSKIWLEDKINIKLKKNRLM